MDDKSIRNAERNHDRHTDWLRQVNEASIRSADAGAKAVVYTNGGAVVAALTLLAALSTRKDVTGSMIHDIAGSLFSFAGGVAFGLCCILLIYFVHLRQADSLGSRKLLWHEPFIEETDESRRHDNFRLVLQIFAILSAFVSLALFVNGLVDIRAALEPLAKLN